MEDEKIKDLNSRSGRISKLKLTIIISIAIFVVIYLMFQCNFSLNAKYYNSLKELAEDYYPDENAVYLQEQNYCYVIVDSEDLKREEFVYKTDDGKYIVFKNLILERLNRRRYFQYRDIVSENFYSFVHVEIHDGYCILLLERYFVNDEKVEVVVYDNFEQLQPIKTYSREYYFKVLKMDSLDENYEIRVDIGERHSRGHCARFDYVRQQRNRDY